MAPSVSQSAKLYQERREPQFQTTRRAPGPRADFDSNAVHQVSLNPPFPSPEVLHAEDDKPPDAAGTTPWPYGQGEETIV